MIIHTVASGDTVYSISKEYSVPESRIITDNFLDPTKKLAVGQTLIISRPTETCTVRGGDTLASISERHNVSIASLIQNNPLLSAEGLLPSQVLNINYDRSSAKEITVSAYTGSASPYETESRLPYISMLHVQNASYVQNGELTLLKNAEPLVALAKKHRALPILSVDCADEYGRWQSRRLEEIAESPILCEKFIQSVLLAIKNHGFAGIEIMMSSSGNASEFRLHEMLLSLQEILKENNYIFIIPYVPNYTSERNSETFSDISDFLPLFTYVWDDAERCTPAAPINKTVEFLSKNDVSKYHKKALLGIPLFGIEYTRFASRSQKEAVSALQGLELLQRLPTTSKFDVHTMTPYVEYSERNRYGEPQKALHYEDARSYYEKLSLVEKYGLAGVNVTSLDYSAPVFWQILNQRFKIIKF